MCAAAATAVSYEGGSCKFDDTRKQYRFSIIIIYRLISSLLVKAFLAKAKDEFQVKYDKPGQVGKCSS